MNTQKIDIIVPCYKAHKTLPRLLGSIICQDIVDDLEVTLVNDGDENDYSEIITQFSPFVKIKEVKVMGVGTRLSTQPSTPLYTGLAFYFKKCKKSIPYWRNYYTCSRKCFL